MARSAVPWRWPVLWAVSAFVCIAFLMQRIFPSPSPSIIKPPSDTAAAAAAAAAVSAVKVAASVARPPPPQRLLPIVNTWYGAEVISQIPKSPRAILFLAHGCGCRPSFFWDKCHSCPHCIGMPEERVYIIKALERRYAIIAISSKYPCWNFDQDNARVLSILKSWIEENLLGHLPVFGLGASSGGYFVSALALKFRFRALTLMISEGHFNSMKFDNSYPPTLFVHMPLDEERAEGVKLAMRILRDKGVSTNQVRCQPVKLDAGFFLGRIQGMDPELSERIFLALRGDGYLDEDGFMVKDGRDTFSMPWHLILPKEENGTGVKWLQHVREELNLAYAYHEMTSLPANKIFNWFKLYMG